MTEIIQHPAQQIVVNFDETFDEASDRICIATKQPIQHANGKPVTMTPGTHNCFLKLELEERKATPEEFDALCGAIMMTIKQFEAQKLLPENWVKRVATPFDVTVPPIPERLLQAVRAGYKAEVHLSGDVYVHLTQVPIEEEFNEEDENEFENEDGEE